MQSYVQVLKGAKSIPRERPKRRDGTGPYRYLKLSELIFLISTGRLPATLACAAACFAGFFQRTSFGLIAAACALRFHDEAASTAHLPADIALAFGADRNGFVIHTLLPFKAQTASAAFIFIGRHFSYPFILFKFRDLFHQAFKKFSVLRQRVHH